jgi:hypothetical protein
MRRCVPFADVAVGEVVDPFDVLGVVVAVVPIDVGRVGPVLVILTCVPDGRVLVLVPVPVPTVVGDEPVVVGEEPVVVGVEPVVVGDEPVVVSEEPVVVVEALLPDDPVVAARLALVLVMLPDVLAVALAAGE